MKRKLPVIFSIAMLSIAIFIKISDFYLVEQLQLKVFDAFQIQKPREYSQQPIKILDIDDASLERLGQWPWPRSLLAKIVDRLNEAGAAAIAMDIVFAEEDRTSPKNILPLWQQSEQLGYLQGVLPDHDELFAKSISQANVVTGFVLTQDGISQRPTQKAGYSFAGEDPRQYISQFNGYVNSLSNLEIAANGNGALNSLPDTDGILRRMPLAFVAGDRFEPSLSAEALRIAQGASSYIIKSVGASDEASLGQGQGVTAIKVGAFEVPTDASGQFWLYYTRHVTERYIPVWKILQPGFDLSQLEGQIIFIGTSAAGLKDIRATPLNPTISGVEVHAQALEQVLTGEYLKRPDWMHGAEIILMVVVGIILIIVMAKLSAIWGAVFTVFSLTCAVMFSWQAFVEYHILIDPVTPGIAITLLYLSESMIRYISSERERQQVRNAFSHYMSPALVDQLAKNPDALALGGETKELSLLFCDIRGFTTISESFTAQDLTKFINKFLTPMTEIILDNRGTIDKYMGDCIMAFWNAPLDDANHARNSCISALQMVKALVDFNADQEIRTKEHGKPFVAIRIGIGVNTGECCVGNMGSDQRFDYSVLGDDVNLASRLEGQSKTYGVDIVIGEKTRSEVGDMATIELDLIRVKGKTQPVHIYALLGDEELSSNQHYQALIEKFNNMLQNYRSQNWSQAEEALSDCENLCKKIEELDLSGLFSLYTDRINEYRLNPPGEDWDGVFVATSK